MLKNVNIEPITAPCDACTFAAQCKAEKLSCSAFNDFVSSGVARKREDGEMPSGYKYRLIFPED